ncbi:hypothetical protein PSM7751_03723 [Pseudooceanicola marinus]|uniref:Uncharacterized protein n=2 Tax=Pseudooceanicola marinus TaxID=396013 RepID=A0A1X7A4G6_9RHOB|nr:hypothetical protein PSM7751_03723 [Pseudooceanicola marinus]
MPDNPNFAARPATVVRIEQPRCAHSFGVGGCAADPSAAPCYRTRGTCRAVPSYEAGAPLMLYYCFPGGGRPSDDLLFVPLLEGVSLSSPKINVSGADKRLNPFGLLGSGRLTFLDAEHSDYLVDPYRAQRGAPLVGTYWGRWLARNQFARAGMVVSVFEGFDGEPLSTFVRTDMMTDGIDRSGGEVVMNLTDILQKVRAEGLKVPQLSPGELREATDAVASAIEISGASLDDYPVQGEVRIGDEIVTYTSAAINAEGYLELSGLVRGADGSAASDHGAGDRVQRCLRLDGLSVDQGLALIYGETPMPADYLPLDEWAAEVENYLAPYILDGLISEPLDAGPLIGEILEQCQACQWFDGEARKVRLWAVKPMVNAAPVLTEERHIIGGSLEVRDFPDRRVSQAWVYYEPRERYGRGKNPDDFRRGFVSADLGYETEATFGAPAIRTIMARYIGARAVAAETTGRILARYSMGTSEAKFALLDRDAAAIGIGSVVILSSEDIQAEDGSRDLRLWVVTSAEPKRGTRQVHFTAEDATLAGTLTAIQEDGVPDYQGDGSDNPVGAFIGNDAGLLPDGRPCALIQ